MTDVEDFTRKLKEAKRKRGLARTQVTKLYNKVTNESSSWNFQQASMNLMKTKNLHVSITTMDAEIMDLEIKLGVEDRALSEDADDSERYTDCLLTIVSILETPTPPPSTGENFSNQNANNSYRQSKSLRLPPIELPTYANKKCENIMRFFQIFDAIIEKQTDLSEHQQYLLLRGQLADAPKILVDTLDFELHTYAKAKEALLDAFDSTEKSKSEIIESMATLSLKPEEEPYRFIGEVRTIMSAIKSLKIEVHDILRFFFWKGLNRQFQTHLTHITNKSLPSLDECNQNIFEAANRYNDEISSLKLESNFSKLRNKPYSKESTFSKESTAMAVNVDTNRRVFCPLCKADGKKSDHYLSKCPNYETGKKKCDKLRILRACIRCGFSTHESKVCSYVLKSKCRHCNGDHMSFLCFKPPKVFQANAALVGESTEADCSEGSSVQNANCIVTYNSGQGSSLVLPTFTGEIKSNENHDYAPLRIFKDGGSQASLVCASIAARYKLPVVKDNVPLSIHGFNSTKRINTKIVRTTLKFGEKVFNKDMLCVDNIRTKFGVEGLGKVVSGFQERGYEIADKDYSSETGGVVENIDMILGTDCDHMVPLEYCVFGPESNLDSSSCFIETPLGIVFSGSIEKMIENLPFLPSKLININVHTASVSYPLDALEADLQVTLPNPVCSAGPEVSDGVSCAQATAELPSGPTGLDAKIQSNPVISIERYSSLDFSIRVAAKVIYFVDKLKAKREKHWLPSENPIKVRESFEKARFHLISSCQQQSYKEVFDFLISPSKHLKDIPPLITKFNLYRDKNNLLRIRSKFQADQTVNPILLPKSSALTTLIVREVHGKMNHVGLFSVLRELRKNFWIESSLSAVKKVLKSCVICRRIHERPIKLNQNSYRPFRASPPQKCFKSVFIDHIGPFQAKINGERTKVWFLIVSCLFSRAINLKICRKLDVHEFLRALQLHTHEFGMFQDCLSDLGSSFRAGANSTKAFLSDPETQVFLASNGIREVSFEHYAKGNSSLGSLVESAVKQTKFMMQKAIGQKVLDYFSLEFLVSQAVSLINKRPVAFKEQLGSLTLSEVPTCITPEMLLYGSECPTVNLIPSLQPVEEEYTPNRTPDLSEEYVKLRESRSKLISTYHSDFLVNLISQAVDKPGRYTPVVHKAVSVGDVVLLVDPHLKQYRYPMGRVLRVETNSLGESTSATIRMANTKEEVYRHTSSIILLIPHENLTVSTVGEDLSSKTVPRGGVGEPTERIRPPSRTAAIKAKERLKALQGDA